MPHHKAYKKSMRKDARARQENRAYRSQMRSIVRKVRESRTQAEGQEVLRQAVSILDHLASKGVIHRNNASNHKSKLSQYVAKLPA
ncbi:MAG: 30S ribosomal protein S20 [Candidatus Zixiibacteriota bacterium]|nr:MAG: 30S ribosomal protein S20 [candidate division Zixibacteria bacterium]